MNAQRAPLAALLFALLALLPLGATNTQPADERPLHTQRLGDRVLLAWVGDAMQTIRVVALSAARGIVVIDTNLSRSADVRIRRAIEQAFGGKDVRYVINTHFHHDHTCGNQVYSDATIVGHRTVPDGMRSELTGDGLVKQLEKLKGLEKQWEERSQKAPVGSREALFYREGAALAKATIAELQDGFRPTFPMILFEKRLVLDMGDMSVELYAVGGTHTPGDIMIFVPEEGLVAIGDMWPDRMLPYLPKAGTWNLDEILENWRRVVDGGRSISHVNMSHSDMTLGVEMFKEQYRYLRTLWDGVRETQRQGATLDAARQRYTIERDFPYFKDRLLKVRGASIHDNNVEAIWDRLGGK